MRRYSLRRIGGVVLAAAAVGLGVGVWQGGVVGGGGGGTVFYISTTGSDVNPGTSASPFLTMNKCYQAVTEGNGTTSTPTGTCYLKTGAFGDQTIRYSNAKPAGSTCRLAETFGDNTSTTQNLSGCILFTSAPAATVTTGSIVISAPYVWLNGLTATTPTGTPNAIEVGEDSGESLTCSDYAGLIHDIIVQNVSNQTLFLKGGSYIYVKGSTFDQSHQTVQGTAQPTSSVWNGCVGGTPFELDHFAIDGDTFSNLIQTCDGTGTCGAQQHLECVHWFDGYDMILQNSKFLNCAQFDISMADNNLYANANISHVLIQNNVFDSPCSHQTLNVASGGPGGPNGYACGSTHSIDWQCSQGTGPTTTDTTWRFNSFSTGGGTEKEEPQILTNTGTGCPNSAIYGNSGMYQTSFTCGKYNSGGAPTFDYNVMSTASTGDTPAACGAHDSINNAFATMYTSESGYDFTIGSGGFQTNFLTQASMTGYPSGNIFTGWPSTDLLGNPRPAAGGSANIDAGAYEKTGS